MPPRALADNLKAEVRRLLDAGTTFAEITARTGVSAGSIHKIKHERPPAPLFDSASLQTPPPAAEPELPEPMPEAGGAELPESLAETCGPFVADGARKWLVMGDVHLPYHSPEAVRAAVEDGKKFGADGILLNGDTLDFYSLSHHYREPNKARVKTEIEQGREFLRWVRSQFPRARLVFKEGNHDERLKRYLAERAPEVFDLDDLYLPNLLRADDVGAEWVTDKRVVMVGKLAVVHGHEYRGGGGVQPSRWLYLRTGDSTLTNHFHRTDHYTFRTVTDREVGMWSVGCLCHLKPNYAPLNQWTNGWALIEVDAAGGYTVTNRQRLRNGRVV